MLASWLHIRVELEGGAGIECDPPPGRILLVGPQHTFFELAEAIDVAFARWDVAHLHAFELEDGRLIGLPDDEPIAGSRTWLDHTTHTVAGELELGEEFAYIFDLAESWQHACRVLDEPVDPVVTYGAAPEHPAIVFGWGWIPDQYGRTSSAGADLGV